MNGDLFQSEDPTTDTTPPTIPVVPGVIPETEETAFGFELTLIISLCLCLLFITCFSLIRGRLKTFYQPNACLEIVQKRYRRSSSVGESEHHKIGRGHPAECPDGLFSWIPYTLRYSGTTLLKRAGFDAVMYLKFLKYNMILFGVMAVLSNLVLLPINFASDNKAKDSEDSQFVNGIYTLTLSNIPQKSDKMWVHLISVFLFSGFAYYFIYKLYQAHIECDPSYTAVSKHTIQSRTVIVSEIPHEVETNEDLLNIFAEYWGKENIVDAHFVPRVGLLEILSKKRSKYLKEQRVAYELFKKNRKRPTHRIGPLPFMGPVVDSMYYYEKKMEEVKLEMDEVKSCIQMTRAAFITFTSVRTATMCAQVLHDRNPKTLVIQPAPESSDINWYWFNTSRLESGVRMFVTYFFIFLLFFFWSIPITFISAFANLTSIGKVPFLNFIVDFLQIHTFLRSLVEGFLPTLALIIFLVALPYILRELLKQRGFRLHTQFERQLIRLYWLFLLLNVLLISVVAGSIFNILHKLINNPAAVVSLMATALPTQALYFTNYIILQGYAGYPLFWMLRLDELLICKFKHWFLCRTELERRKAEEPVPIFYGLLYARELLVFSIALIYSSMVPIILPFACLFFAISYLTAKYNFIFVYNKRFEGLRPTYLVMQCSLVGILIYQFTMIGIFGLKLFPPGLSILIGLGISSAIWFYMAKDYSKPLNYLALRECPSDPFNADTSSQQKEKDLIYRMYMHPALRPKKQRPDVKEASIEGLDQSEEVDDEETRILEREQEEGWDEEEQIEDDADLLGIHTEGEAVLSMH